MKIIEKFPSLASKVNTEYLRSLVENIDAVDFNGSDTALKKDQSLVIADKVTTQAALSAFSNPKVQHLIQTGRTDFFREIMTSCMIINDLEKFWANPVPFFVNNFEGLDNYQTTFRSAEFDLKTTEDQAALLKQLRAFLLESPYAKKSWASVVLIADELLANAFFNGPMDKNLKPLNKGLARSGKIETSEEIRFFIAHDNSRLMLGCEDPFGSVDRQELISKLGRVYKSDPVNIDVNDVSAGMGCKMMIDCSSGFYLIVKNLKKTLVFCTLDLGKREIESVEDPKHIHLCFL